MARRRWRDCCAVPTSSEVHTGACTGPGAGARDKWCPGRDSNPHGRSRGILSPLCLPISPPGRAAGRVPNGRGSRCLREPAWDCCGWGGLAAACCRRARCWAPAWVASGSAGGPGRDPGRERPALRVGRRNGPWGSWRLRSESNRRPRLCRPLHNHSATQPKPLSIASIGWLVMPRVSRTSKPHGVQAADRRYGQPVATASARWPVGQAPNDGAQR